MQYNLLLIFISWTTIARPVLSQDSLAKHLDIIGMSKNLNPYDSCLLAGLEKIKLSDPDLDQKIISVYQSCKCLMP